MINGLGFQKKAKFLIKRFLYWHDSQKSGYTQVMYKERADPQSEMSIEELCQIREQVSVHKRNLGEGQVTTEDLKKAQKEEAKLITYSY